MDQCTIKTWLMVEVNIFSKPNLHGSNVDEVHGTLRRQRRNCTGILL